MEQTGTASSLRDVAAHAGVSTATASRVLNGSQAVRSPARRRVLAAADELDYRPNRLASSLRRLKSDTIGVVVSDIENPHFTSMIRSVEDAAYAKGLAVLVCNTDDNGEKQASYLERLASQRVQGVLLSPIVPASPEIVQLLDLGIPVVAFDRGVDDPRADAVVANNHGGARAATNLLISLAHLRIGFISGPVALETGAQRMAGYRSAMIESGLEPLVSFGGFRETGGYAAAMQLLAGTPRPTALFAANNLMSLGAMRAIRELGLSVPGDVSLVSIDDPNWAPFVDPPLTTFAQPVEEMARKAVELLLERASGVRRTPVRLMYDFTMQLRDSCAQPVAHTRTAGRRTAPPR